MPLLHQTALATTLTLGLLMSLPLRAAGQSEATIPVRSLAGELAGVDEGTPAYIHTHYGTGTGVLLSSRNEVVTARHNVLTPSGSVADEIAVGVAQMPLHNVVETRVVAVAQDPEQDLVLLRPVQGVFPTAVQQGSFAHTPVNCTLPGSAPCSSSMDTASGKQASTPRREMQAKAGLVRARHSRRARPHPAVRLAEQQPSSPAPHPVAVHVVQDGPAARKGTTPSPSPHDVAVKRRVVDDGPLRPR